MFGRLGMLLIGGALGAWATMQLAPRAGSEAREQLRQRADTMRDQYGNLIEQGRVRATELVKSGLDMVDTRLQQGQELVNSGIERARGGIDHEGHHHERTERTETARGEESR